MKNRRSLSSSEDVTDINISPLIDMVFILLIFFIVTTVFVDERGIPIIKPGIEGVPDPDRETVTFIIRGTGQVMHEDREVGLSGVGAVVRAAIQREQVPIIIQAEPQARAGVIVRALDESRGAGAENVSISQTSQ